MDNEFKADLITLIDEENIEHNFEILDIIENDKGIFYALLPIFNDAEEEIQSSGEYYIMEIIEENGEEQLAEVEDDDLLDELAEEFENHFDSLFSDEENESK